MHTRVYILYVCMCAITETQADAPVLLMFVVLTRQQQNCSHYHQQHQLQHHFSAVNDINRIYGEKQIKKGLKCKFLYRNKMYSMHIY